MHLVRRAQWARGSPCSYLMLLGVLSTELSSRKLPPFDLANIFGMVISSRRSITKMPCPHVAAQSCYSKWIAKRQVIFWMPRHADQLYLVRLAVHLGIMQCNAMHARVCQYNSISTDIKQLLYKMKAKETWTTHE